MKRVLVVGDSMLDVAYRGQVSRICPEAPVPILNIERTDYYAGGAANVALNLRSLGVPVQLVTGWENYSEAGAHLSRLWGDLGVFQVNTERVTTKHRLFSGNTLLYRFDDNYEAICRLSTFRTALNEWNPEIVVFSDYGRGVLDEIQGMISECRLRKIGTVVDPKGSKWHRYSHADIIKCNAPEANGLPRGVAATISEYDINRCVVTSGGGEVGQYAKNSVEYWRYGVQKVTPVDVTGAGDSFLAGMVWSLARGKTLSEAIWAGAAAGTAAVCHPGTHIVTL